MSKDPHADDQKDFTEGKYEPSHSITPLDYAIHSDHTLEEDARGQRPVRRGLRERQKPEVRTAVRVSCDLA
jgi:hypothetical protein